MLQRGGTQSDPADLRPARRDGGQLAGAAPYQEHPGEDAALPPRWEGNKNEGKFVTVARTPRMQSMMRKGGDPPTPPEKDPTRGNNKKARPATGTWGQEA